eukprot:4850926-Prymnesium_polylepis.1
MSVGSERAPDCGESIEEGIEFCARGRSGRSVQVHTRARALLARGKARRVTWRAAAGGGKCGRAVRRASHRAHQHADAHVGEARLHRRRASVVLRRVWLARAAARDGRQQRARGRHQAAAAAHGLGAGRARREAPPEGAH